MDTLGIINSDGYRESDLTEANKVRLDDVKFILNTMENQLENAMDDIEFKFIKEIYKSFLDRFKDEKKYAIAEFQIGLIESQEEDE